jgi:hypothetical protein
MKGYEHFVYLLITWSMGRENVVCTTAVKFHEKLVTLGYASCDNSFSLGGKAALYYLDSQITITSSL